MAPTKIVKMKKEAEKNGLGSYAVAELQGVYKRNVTIEDMPRITGSRDCDTFLSMDIQELIEKKALFVINHSGGKDSQAMTIRLARIVPKDQLVIIHAHLPEVEWDGSLEHIQDTSYGIPVLVCEAVKTFFQMVDHRKRFPDAGRRQCTSDLKRGPIEKEIRKICRERGLSLIVNCMGMRSQESSNRAKLETFKLNKKNSVAGRTWYDYLPIHALTTKEVFQEIADAGQKPFWIYAKGMSRKSCCFCIMANQGDLRIAASLRPELYKRYVEKERELNFTLQMSRKTLVELTGVDV